MKTTNSDQRRCILFCNLVRSLRFETKITQKEMASILGVGVGSVRKLERGVIPARLTPDAISRLYKEFGIHQFK